MIHQIIPLLKSKRFSLQNEKQLQQEIEELFHFGLPLEFKREFHLDNNNIIDFLVCQLGIEVKINAQRRAIYKQCERYCEFDQIKQLLLITNRSMGFPEQINGKDCFLFNLSKSWL